jgi:dihydroorotase
MSGDLTIQQARLVLPDRCVVGDLLIRDGTIAAIAPRIDSPEGEVIDGTGLVCMPGAIDAHVQFRDPGQTHKEDLRTGSRAAASGGVTAFLDMPNTHPATTSVAALDDKFARM